MEFKKPNSRFWIYRRAQTYLEPIIPTLGDDDGGGDGGGGPIDSGDDNNSDDNNSDNSGDNNSDGYDGGTGYTGTNTPVNTNDNAVNLSTNSWDPNQIGPFQDISFIGDTNDSGNGIAWNIVDVGNTGFIGPIPINFGSDPVSNVVAQDDNLNDFDTNQLQPGTWEKTSDGQLFFVPAQTHQYEDPLTPLTSYPTPDFSNSSSEEPSLINTPYDVPQTPTEQQETPSLDDNSANNTPTPNPSSDDDSTNNPVNNALTNLLNGTNSNNPWQNNPYAQDATGVNNPPMSSPVSNQFSNKPLTPQEIHNLLLNPHTAIIGNSLVNNKIPWGNIAVKSLGIKNGNQ